GQRADEREARALARGRLGELAGAPARGLRGDVRRDARPPRLRAAGVTAPHPVFAEFPSWEGEAGEGWHVNFLGVRTRHWQFVRSPGPPPRRFLRPPPPPVNEELLEWIDLLDAVSAAWG